MGRLHIFYGLLDDKFYKLVTSLVFMRDYIFFVSFLIIILPMVFSAGCGDFICDIEDPDECLSDCPDEVYNSSEDLPFGEKVFEEDVGSDAEIFEGVKKESFFSSVAFKIVAIVFILIISGIIGFVVYLKMKEEGENSVEKLPSENVSLEGSVAAV